MAGRPRSFDRDAAVGRFVDLFWSRGYAGTSVDELQALIGVKRGSFYAAFGDKDGAYLAALERYVSVTTATNLEILSGTGSPRAGLAAFLRFAGRFLSDNRGRGCLLLTAIAQPPPVGEVAAAALRKTSASLMSRVAAAARAAAKRGELGSAESPEGIGAYVIGVLLGLNAMARTGSRPRTIRAMAETAAALLETAAVSSEPPAGFAPSEQRR